MTNIKTGLIGATGYTGCEVLRLLGKHPQASLVAVAASDSGHGKKVGDIWPHLSCYDWPALVKPDDKAFLDCDLVFMATPNGIAMKLAPKLLDAGVKVIDLSADFRLRDQQSRKQWYPEAPQTSQKWQDQAVYGLPELFAKKIAPASLIANPGCFPTAVTLPLAPLLRDSHIASNNIIVDAKSGTSGAGKNNAPVHAETSDSIHAYAASGHRHSPEMLQALTDYSKQTDINMVFVPHLAPMNRGILASIYVQANKGNNADSIREKLQQSYAESAFVQIAPGTECLATSTVRGSNLCRISVQQQAGTIIILSVIDNLIKGAAGQAVQNMNLMFQLPQHTGLDSAGIMP